MKRYNINISEWRADGRGGKMKNEQKVVFYELNPRFFKDASGDGIGDLAGLAQKFDYFAQLGVNGLILQNVLSVDTGDAAQSFMTLASGLGTPADLTKLVSAAQSHHIRLMIELNIGSIKKSNQWFGAFVADHASDLRDLIKTVERKPEVAVDGVEYVDAAADKFVAQDIQTKEIPLNWKADAVMKQFVKVIDFWTKAGIGGFVFKNFEYAAEDLTSPTKTAMSLVTQKELRKFYRAIKMVDEGLVIIGKSHTISYTDGAQHTAEATRVFDYFMSTTTAMLGTKDGALDAIGHFRIKELATALVATVADQRNIVVFGSDRIGRIASRWGTDGALHAPAAKTLALALLLSPNASVIYCGDEIGTRNLGFNHLDDFQDETLEVRKQKLHHRPKAVRKLMNAQILQHPINARSLMAWDATKNGGFSSSATTVAPIANSYREINVATELADPSSVLHFYRDLIALLRDPKVAAVMSSGKWQVKATNKIMRIRIRSGNGEITALLNFTAKRQRASQLKGKGDLVISTYHDDSNIVRSPGVLQPYESVMLLRWANERPVKSENRKASVEKLQKLADREATAALELPPQKPNTTTADAFLAAEAHHEKQRLATRRHSEVHDTATEDIETSAWSQVAHDDETATTKTTRTKTQGTALTIPTSSETTRERTKTKATNWTQTSERPIVSASQTTNTASAIIKEEIMTKKFGLFGRKHTTEQPTVSPQSGATTSHDGGKKAMGMTRETAKRQLMMEDEARQKVARRYGEATTLLDSQVAKTTQVDVDDVEDVESFLRELDEKKR